MKIFEFSNNTEQATALAHAIAGQMQSLLQTQPQITLAVSGGKSPLKFFEQLSRCKLAWDKITVTLVDERFIATDHPDSNENLVRKHLLINYAEAAHFVSLVTTPDILNSVNNANLQISSIDIAVLGMGGDGHTASIFPDCPELERALDLQSTPKRYLITTPTSANYQRIGLSLAGILEIPHLYLSISGELKHQILTQAAKTQVKDYPISYLLAERKDLQIYWSL